MKSLLVDVLRQKDDNRDDEGLSDSGSYATSRADVAATGSGEAGESGVPGDLELMATGAFIVANDERPPKPGSSAETDTDNPTFVGLTRTMLSDSTRVITPDAVVEAQDSLPSMPPVARYTPLVCVALAVLAALTWFGFQQLELQQEQPRLAGSANVLGVDPLAGESGIVGTVPRFRYLGVDGQPLDEEAWQ
ncbi:MAG: hypothetical protein QNJ11_06900 [Woeseiaceae bacterium]|nr:hypothetical protein [Woeseiaceae bacterium]